jgi:hypothetical protein
VQEARAAEQAPKVESLNEEQVWEVLVSEEFSESVLAEEPR